MLNSNLILSRKNEIQELISINNLKEAVKRLMDFTTEFCPSLTNDAIAISRSLNSLEFEEIRGKVTFKEADSFRNIVTDRTLTLLNSALKELIPQQENSKASLIIGHPEHLIELAEEIRQRETPNNLALRARIIQKEYAKTGFQIFLDHLDLRLGEITGLVGENATGKTTLIRILAGDLKYSKGELYYPLFQKGIRLNWLRVKPLIAYVPQEIAGWKGSLIENLRYNAALHGIKGKENEKAVEFIIQRLSLDEHIDKDWQQLSGGYKFRFSLANALVWKPKLLILDEPLANLDIKTQTVVLNDLQNLVKSLRYPMAVLLSSQNLHEIELIADQILFMRNGILENLGKRTELGVKRTFNFYELTCQIGYKDFLSTLKDFPHQKVWYDGMNFFLITPIEISGFLLMKHLNEHGVKIQHFRDLSRSVKTMFYEEFF